MASRFLQDGYHFCGPVEATWAVAAQSIRSRPSSAAVVRAGLPAWLAPAPRVGSEATGWPGLARCLFEHPGDLTVEPLAQFDGGLDPAERSTTAIRADEAMNLFIGTQAPFPLT
jgi:hypothetical protein